MNTILLLLRTPPPYGGGEIRSASLSEYVSDLPDFVVHEVCSSKRDKSNQGRFALWKLSAFAKDWWTMVRLIVKHRPSLVFHSTPQGFPHFLRDSLLTFTARLLGVGVVSELASDVCPFFGASRFATWYGRLVVRRMLCLRVLGEGIARRLAQYGITNTIVTDNGVGVPDIDAVRSTLKGRPMRFAFIGTHSPEKGFDVLVDACATLCGTDARFQVHCVGEWCSPSFRESMAARMKERGIDDMFTLHGPVRGAEKWRPLAESDVLVLPSLTEGQPLVILEAFACGLPVIATTVGGIPEIVEDPVNGLLVPAGSAEALAGAMERLMGDEGMRNAMAEANPKLFRERFTESAWLESQVAWLRKCASGQLNPHGQRFIPEPQAR
ncbi:glycosyltransferase family 4 protein [Verrucomicrobiota bacterium]